MIAISPSNTDIVKNYFLKEGDIGKVIKVEVKEWDSLKLSYRNYLSQMEVGSYNMNKKFEPGEYYFLWIEFNRYIRHVFIAPVKGNDNFQSTFFYNVLVKLKFDRLHGIEVW